jgi:hypothetical protein
MSWLGARKVLVPDGEAVTPGADGEAGADEVGADEAGADEAGALGDPVGVDDPADVGDPVDVLTALAAVEVVDELQAVTSKAAQASPGQKSTAPAATRRYLRGFVIDISSHPLNFPKAARKPCHLYDVRRNVLVGNQMGNELNQGPFRMSITAGTGYGG